MFPPTFYSLNTLVHIKVALCRKNALMLICSIIVTNDDAVDHHSEARVKLFAPLFVTNDERSAA